MDLYTIRQKVAYNPNSRPTVKDELRKYFTSISSRFPIAVTLTFKQSYAVHTVKGTHYKKLDSDAVKRAVKHFQNKLNQQVYGSAAKRYGKKLSYIPVIEGEKSGKHLHVHMVIGDIPQHVMLNQIDTLVTKAKTSVELIDEQHKVTLAWNSDWLADYLLKEAGNNTTDTVLWDLC